MSSSAALQRARNHFLGNFATSIVVLLVLMVIPKDDKPGSLLRLMMTAAFFLFAITLLWSFTEPLDRYLGEYLASRYEAAGSAVDQTLALIRFNLMAFIQPIAWIGIIVVGCIALDVLSVWPAFATLQSLGSLPQWGWFLGLILLVLMPFIRSRQMFQALNLTHLLREQLATIGFVPKTAEERERLRKREVEPPVVIFLDGGRFRAVGFDWDWSDFYKNVIVFGQTGSGKTVCVLNALLDGLLRTSPSGLPPAGLILDPKGDFKDKIVSLMRRIGREDDLLIFDPESESSFHWNPFDSPDDALEVANRFGAILEMRGGATRGSGDSAFFKQQTKSFLQASLTIMRLVAKADQIPSVYQFVEFMGDQKKLASAINQIEKLEKRGILSAYEKRQFEAASRYLEEVWEPMTEKTKSNLVATLSNILSAFIYPPFDKITAGRSTLQLSECIDTGKVLYVHSPIAERRLMTQIVGTLMKVEYGRQVLLRRDKPRPSFFFSDEFQVFFTVDEETADSNFFERSRNSNHANIVATQNRPALFKSGGKDYVVDNFLGHCATKMFLRNTEMETNKWASELFGQRIETMPGTTRQAGHIIPRHSNAGTGVSSSSNYAPIVRPEAFTRLAQPSREDEIGYCDSIVHSAGRAVVSQENLRWLVHPL